MLTDTAIKKAQPSAKPYRLTDERGLTLRVQPTYLPQRAKMMQWWGDYLERAARGNVVPLKVAA